CPVVVPIAPAVGPDPASRDACSLVTFSISAVHGPAAAVPSGKATMAQAPSSNVIVFMSFSPDSRILQVEITTEEANLRSRTIAGAGLHVRREMKEDEEVANNMSPTISRIVGQVGEDNTTVTSRSI